MEVGYVRKETWENFVSRVEVATGCDMYDIDIEVIGSGGCLPGPIVAKRKHIYICERNPEPQSADDFVVCVLV